MRWGFDGNIKIFLACMYKIQKAIVITLTSLWECALGLASHFKVLHQIFFMLWARPCQASCPVWGHVLFYFSMKIP